MTPTEWAIRRSMWRAMVVFSVLLLSTLFIYPFTPTLALPRHILRLIGIDQNWLLAYIFLSTIPLVPAIFCAVGVGITSLLWELGRLGAKRFN